MSKRSGKKGKPKKSTQQKRVPQSRNKTEKRDLRWIAVVGIIALVVLIGVGGYWLINRDIATTQPPIATEVTSLSETPTPDPTPTLPPNIGPVTACVSRPNFLSSLELPDTVYIGTNLRGYTGLTFSAEQPDGSMIVYQHPSWRRAGNLAAFASDRDGNIYVGPAPYVSVEENPPEEQNTLFWVDTNTGIMEKFLELPAALPATSANPFGIMGLTYDCDTHSLYTSSIAGSTYDEEVGRIFQINLNDKSIASRLDDVDVFGLGVYRGVNGKRLYLGSARNSSIRSVVLEENGGLGTEQRLEFYLQALPGGGDDRAKRIQFPKSAVMQIKGIEFNYSLRAASDQKERVYINRYLPSTDAWEFEDVYWRDEI